jgi:hypothetical protein
MKATSKRRKGWLAALGAVGVVALLAFVVAAPAGATAATLNPAGVGATNPGFKTGPCPATGSGAFGWHFVLPGSPGEPPNPESFNSISVTFQNAGVVTAFVYGTNKNQVYVFTPTADTLVSATADVNSSSANPQFNLSHVCTTTAETPPDTTAPPGETTVTPPPNVGGVVAETPASPGQPPAQPVGGTPQLAG